MNISEGLQTLINATLTDNKISRKERNILIQKAEKEGIDKDEFEIYLNSQLQLVKPVSNNSGKLLSFGKWIVEKKRRVIIAFYILISIVGGIVAIGTGIFKGIEENNLSEARGCDNVADCLTKYKFEEARAYAGTDIYDLRDIIKSEVSFYLSKGAKEKAFNTLMEYSFDKTPVFLAKWSSDNDYYNKEANWFNSIISESLIVEFEEDKKMLKKLIFSIKPTVIPDGKGEDSDGNYHFIEDNSTQKKMMKRYRIK